MAFGLAIAVIGLIISAVSAGSSIYQAKKAETRSGKEAAARKRAAALEARRRHVKEQRTARIQRAKIQARQAASGAIGSSALGSATGIQTAADANQLSIEQGLDLQNEQIDLNQQQTADQANAQIGQAIGSFAASAITPTGTDQQSPVERIFG